MARDIAASHHEKFDGTGYPQCLAGQQIPFCGRVVALADVYDALTSRRVYKEALPHEKAREAILRERGKHFDPDIVDAFLAAEKEIISVRERLRDPSTVPEFTEARMEEESAPVALRPCPILLVDDSPTELKLQAAALARTGEPVFTAKNSIEAMQVFRAQHPGLIVSDLEMPGASGLDLCRQIRSLANAGPVHFIMLTGHTDENSTLEAYKAGVDDFVGKSFSSDELLARVKAGLRTFRLHQELTRKTSHLQEVNVRLRQMNGRLDRLSITDNLTGLFNRRHAMVRLEEQWATSERYSRPLTVAMIDIDRFKNVNDTHGHDAGDIVLRRIAGILRDQTRGTDAVCRIGGEEFLIIFPSETDQEAIACCQRCRAAVEASPFRVGDVQLPVTISVGIAHRSGDTPQFPDLLRAADRALYTAKRTGRNRVCNAAHQDHSEETTMSDASPPQTPKTAPLPLGDEALIKWDQLIARCGGDAAFAAAVAQRFAKQAPSDLARLEESVANGDAINATRLAHTLKSMAAYMSLETTSALCKTIEDTAREHRLAEAPPPHIPASPRDRSRVGLARQKSRTTRRSCCLSSGHQERLRPAMSKILVVDDTQFWRDTAADILRSKGHNVFTAADGVEGLAALRRDGADLILLDVEMPRMSGLHFLGQVRQNKDWKDLPVIILTGDTVKDDILLAKKLGAVDYILKSRFSVSDLLERVGKRIPLAGARPTAPAVSTPLPAARRQAHEPAPAGCEFKPLLTREQSIQRVDTAIEGRALPGVVTEVIAATDSSRAELSDVASLIGRDYVLTARILQTANSSAYASHRGMISSLADAVRIVGSATIRDIAASVGLFESMPPPGPDGFNPVQCWQHSLAAATMCSLLARRKPRTRLRRRTLPQPRRTPLSRPVRRGIPPRTRRQKILRKTHLGSRTRHARHQPRRARRTHPPPPRIAARRLQPHHRLSPRRPPRRRLKRTPCTPPHRRQLLRQRNAPRILSR